MIAGDTAKGFGNQACEAQLLFNGIIRQLGLAAELIRKFQVARQLVLELRHAVRRSRA